MNEPQSRFVKSADGTRLAIHEEGAGPPLLLVYGALADANYWRALAPYLRGHFRVARLERRGRGESGDSQPYSPQREIEDVQAAIEALGDGCNVFAHSSGAILALQAIEGGRKVRRLMLYEPPINAHVQGKDGILVLQSELMPHLRALLAAGDHAGAVEAFLLKAAEAPAEAVQRIKDSPRWADYLALAHTTIYDSALVSGFNARELSFPGWNTPAQLLVGGTSPQDMASGVQALAAALPGAGLTVLEKEGHNAVYTAPERLFKLIEDFFA